MNNISAKKQQKFWINWAEYWFNMRGALTDKYNTSNNVSANYHAVMWKIV